MTFGSPFSVAVLAALVSLHINNWGSEDGCGLKAVWEGTNNVEEQEDQFRGYTTEAERGSSSAPKYANQKTEYKENIWMILCCPWIICYKKLDGTLDTSKQWSNPSCSNGSLKGDVSNIIIPSFLLQIAISLKFVYFINIK